MRSNSMSGLHLATGLVSRNIIGGSCGYMLNPVSKSCAAVMRNRLQVPEVTMIHGLKIADDPAANYIQNREVNPDPASAASWAQARQWLSHCATSHESCQSPGTGIMPTRVIDLSDGSARLLLTNQGTDEYAALSYCWGTAQPLRTTTQNLQEYMEALPITQCLRRYKMHWL